MKYIRMNITLPKDVVKQLEKVPNKSAFIARALAAKFAAIDAEDDRRRRLAAYRWAAKHPEHERDERPDW